MDGKKYKVIFNPAIERSYTSWTEQEIGLKHENDLLHEVLHLITRTMVLDKKTDEGLVQFFENRLQQLFLENSKFFLSLFQGQ